MQAAVETRDTTRGAAAMAAWARRLQELVEHTRELKGRSEVKEAAVEHLGIKATGDSMRPGLDGMLLVHVKGGVPTTATLNNHSFNQFCQSIGARAGEYRKLPAAIAQIPLMWLTQNADRKDVKMLLTRSEKFPDEIGLTCRAINSSSYGRIWNHELAEAVAKYVDPDVWAIPDASHFHTKTGFISADDRKAFVFLANESNPITLKGIDKPLYRGFYAWNSEVGDGTAGCAHFCYNSVCANRVMVGLKEFNELTIRHTSGAPDRWMQDAVPALDAYVNSGTENIKGLLESSRAKKVAEDDKGALKWLQERGFTKALARAGLESAREGERGADVNSSPFSVYNIVQGLTAEARAKDNNDERVAIELAAGRLFKAVG
jgi:hypothetical protein